MQGGHARSAPDRPAPEPPASDRPVHEPLDAVFVRNYDHHDGHSVHVTVEDPSTGSQLTERCYLAPGQSWRLSHSFEPGPYRLRVRVDGVERARTGCRLGAVPAHTAVVELGNGAVSVTEGPPGPSATA